MQRTLRMWGTPITLILLLGLLVVGAWWGWGALTRPLAPAKADPCVSQSASVLKSTSVTVRVFNGGGKSGLAGSTAAVLRSKGFKVPTVDNAPEKINGTVIVSGKDSAPQVKLVQGFFPGATVKTDKRVDSTVDVTVGSDFGGMKEDAPTEVPIPDGKVCLPASKGPSSTKPR